MDADNDDHSLSVAVIGVSLRFPGASTIEQYWRNIKEKRCSIESIPLSNGDDEHKPNLVSERVRVRSLPKDIEYFDADFFDVNSREAELLDPQFRILLESAFLALESSGYNENRYKERIGVYVGSGANHYLMKNISFNADVIKKMGFFPILLANDKDYAASLLSYKLNLQGPSVSINTACSTGLVSVDAAFKALLNYDCNIALAGASSINASLRFGYDYAEGGILSGDGKCTVFSTESRGTVPASGAGIVVLKRLEDAIEDNDYIHAVIRGSAVNSDGGHKIGMTAPSVKGQARVIAEAISFANIDGKDITYIETHGTGTKLGDAVELQSLENALDKVSATKTKCPVGSIKTNLGHLDSAAGIASLIKVIESLKHKKIPPTLNVDKARILPEMQDSRFYVNDELVDWEPSSGSRIAGVSSFGLGGTNAHVVVEEAPGSSVDIEAQGKHCVFLSARSEDSLAELKEETIDFLLDAKPNLRDVSITSIKHRQQYEVRQYFVADDIESLQKQISATLSKTDLTVSEFSRAPVKVDNRELVMMFPGQGCQSVNMLRELYESEPVYKDTVRYCSDFCEPMLGVKLEELIYTSDSGRDESARLLSQTRYTQPAIFIVEYALFKLLESKGIRPQYTIGHSVGELVSACVSGVFGLEDGLSIIVERGRLIDKVEEGKMIAVSVAVDQLQAQLKDADIGSYWIAAENSPTQTVLSATKHVADEIEVFLNNRGMRSTVLPSKYPFHSELLLQASSEFEASLASVALKKPVIPFISNISGELISDDSAQSPRYWTDQMVKSVKFSRGVQQFDRDSYVFLEVGPGYVLQSLLKQHPSLTQVPCLGIDSYLPKFRDAHLDYIVGDLWMSGVSVARDLLDFESYKKLPLPVNPFNKKKFWLDSAEDRDSGQYPQQELHVSSAKSLDYTGLRRNLDVNSDSNESDVSELLYEPAWMPLSPAAGEGQGQALGNVLLVTGDGHAAVCIKEMFEESSNALVHVVLGENYKKISSLEYRVDACSAESYVKLFADIFSDHGTFDKIIYYPGEYGAQNGLCESDRVVDKCVPLLHFFKSLSACLEHTIDVVLITTNQFSQGSEKISDDISDSVLGAFSLVLPRENQRLQLSNIDLDIEEVLDDKKREGVSKCLCQLLNTEGRFNYPDLILRDERVFIRSVNPVNSLSGGEVAQHKVEIVKNGVYVITGGLGGVGLAIAEALAEQAPCNIVLMSRATKQRAENSDLSEEELQTLVSKRYGEQIAPLERNGANVHVRCVDVTNEDQFSNAISSIEHNIGKINGVIHAAGIVGGGLLQGLDPQVFGSAAAVKLKGVENIRKLLIESSIHGDSLQFVVMCSSLASFFGGVGQLEYCIANRYLDAFSSYYSNKNDSSVSVISINWDGWKEVGMLADNKFLHARNHLLNAEGKAAFIKCLALGTSQLLVIKQDGGHSPRALQTTRKNAVPIKENLSLDEIQSTILSLWCDLLGVENFPNDVSFFEAGGSSLLLVRLNEMLVENFGVESAVADLFNRPTLVKMSEYIFQLLYDRLDAPNANRQAQRPTPQHSDYVSEDIAIIGLACRFPGADSVDKFWGNISGGVESIGPVSDETYAKHGLNKEQLKNTKWVDRVSTIQDIEYFDTGFFGCSPNEAKIIDPQQRVLIECAYEALESSGYANKQNLNAGVYVGVAGNSYLIQNLILNKSSNISKYSSFDIAIANDKDFAATRISYMLGLRGPSVNVNTACSTSLVALHQACNALKSGECDIALAGGIHIAQPHGLGYQYQEGGILSADGKCRTFDSRSNGTVFGDGGGVIAVKLLSKAKRDRDNILAVIKGSAINNDGSEKMGFTVPNGDAQEEVIRHALADANLSTDQVDYIEVHGTATKLGDAVEMAALSRIFHSKAPGSRKLLLGCVKPNIGHLDAAAGVAGLIKLVLTIRNRTIPKLVNFESVNPELKPFSQAFEIPKYTQAWNVEDRLITGGVSSFGIGGTNAHAILQEYPQPDVSIQQKDSYLFTLSAKSELALQAYREEIEYDFRVRGDSHDYFANAAYTLQSGRKVFKYRDVAIIGENGGLNWLGKGYEQRNGENSANANLNAISVLMSNDVIKFEDIVCLMRNSETFNFYFTSIFQLFKNSESTYKPIEDALWQKITTYTYELACIFYLFELGLNVKKVFSENSEALAYFKNVNTVDPVLIKIIQNSEGNSSILFNNADNDVASCLNDVQKECDKTDLEVNGQQSSPEVLDRIKKVSFERDLKEAIYSEDNADRSASGSITDKDLGADWVILEIGAECNVYTAHSGRISEYLNASDQCSHYANLLTAIGGLWMYGFDIDLSPLNRDEALSKIALPTHPFLRDYCWIDKVASGESVQENDSSTKVYVPVWKSLSSAYTLEGGQGTRGADRDSTSPRRYLILLDDLGFGEAVGKLLEQQSCEVFYISVSDDNEISRDNPFYLKINPEVTSHYATSLKMIGELPNGELNIINFWFLSEPQLKNAKSIYSNEMKGVSSLINQAQLLGSISQPLTVRYTAIFKNSCDPVCDTILDSYQSMGISLLKVMQQELSNFTYSCIDIGADVSAANQALCSYITEDIIGALKVPVIAYRNHQRWFPGFEEIKISAGTDLTRPTDIDRASEAVDEHYVIVGGLGKIGAELVSHLLNRKGVRVTVISRSGLSAYSGPHSEQFGSSKKLFIAKADVCKADELEQAFSSAELINGSITGVYYLAGNPVFHFIGQTTSDVFIDSVKVKYDGLLKLQSVLDSRNVKFCVLFSSLSSILGGLGHMAYSAANTSLDAFVESHNRTHQHKWLAVNWDTWQVSAANDAVPSISTSEGINLLESMIEAGVNGRVVVSVGNIDKKVESWISNKLGSNTADADALKLKDKKLRRFLSSEYEAPTTELERLVHDIWVQVLGHEEIGVNDNFYDIGGDSISAIKFANILQEKLDSVVHFSSIFEAQTIRAYARLLQENYLPDLEKLTAISMTEVGERENSDKVMDLPEFRSVIQSNVKDAKNNGTKNSRAIFILSPPRCGSTLLRVMLAGSQSLFSPPELNLMAFNDLFERQQAYKNSKNGTFLTGAIQAVMTSHGLSQEASESYIEELAGRRTTIKAFYKEIQEKIAPKLLVDKTPEYTTDIRTLRQIEEIFEEPLYIALSRHPYGMIDSYEQSKFDLLMSAELRNRINLPRNRLAEMIWLNAQQNIDTFANEILGDRMIRVRYEQLVKEPESVLRTLCAFTGIDFEQSILHPYQNMEKKMVKAVGKAAYALGDLKFHQFSGIQTGSADRWKENYHSDFLLPETIECMQQLGYELIGGNERSPGDEVLFMSEDEI